jgi:hypothetical protein
MPSVKSPVLPSSGDWIAGANLFNAWAAGGRHFDPCPAPVTALVYRPGRDAVQEADAVEFVLQAEKPTLRASARAKYISAHLLKDGLLWGLLASGCFMENLLEGGMGPALPKSLKALTAVADDIDWKPPGLPVTRAFAHTWLVYHGIEDVVSTLRRKLLSRSEAWRVNRTRQSMTSSRGKDCRRAQVLTGARRWPLLSWHCFQGCLPVLSRLAR